MRSRLPTIAHPLAGRAVAWHVLEAMAEIEAAPARLLLLSMLPLDAAITGELPAEVVETPPRGWWDAVAGRLGPEVDHLLIADAAAAGLRRSMAALVNGRAGRVLVDAEGAPLAVWLERGAAEAAAGGPPSFEVLARGLEAVPAEPAEAFLVRDRASLARAGALIRDRLVRRLMAGGATFLLPASVLVDVDVRIGPDSVVYPGVVLEGSTTIGAETVIGPGCRIIDSSVGSGVELKGWNYIVGANIRNRAVLEPYVRRGFD
ncbi:MAG TPA: hypothetical protein VF188_12320 [Longimicrobiales bacterium]